jgi:LPPG:FO 2-phospho-L-lactate transferase
MGDGPSVTVLAGGVGGARFIHGLVQVVPPERVTVVANVGDDFEILGLTVCPDLDTILYTLAEVVNEQTGWGRLDETANALAALSEAGSEDWFFLGDRDIGLHLARSDRLRRGEALSAVTDDLRRRFGLALRLLPASDDPVRTYVHTDEGELDFQTYFVRRRHEPDVRSVRFDGADAARPAPGAVEAIENADLVVIAPSNPYLSIDPILAVPGLREALLTRHAPIAAISPIIGGKAVKGPADRLLRTFAGEASPLAIGRHYAPFLTHLLVDDTDAGAVADLEATGLRVATTDTIMRDRAARARVGRATLTLALGGLQGDE